MGIQELSIQIRSNNGMPAFMHDQNKRERGSYMRKNIKEHVPTCVALDSECTACGGCHSKSQVLQDMTKSLSQAQEEIFE